MFSPQTSDHQFFLLFPHTHTQQRSDLAQSSQHVDGVLNRYRVYSIGLWKSPHLPKFKNWFMTKPHFKINDIPLLFIVHYFVFSINYQMLACKNIKRGGERDYYYSCQTSLLSQSILTIHLKKGNSYDIYSTSL